MAYADQSMSGNRIAALIIVALIHVALIYALVTGLAYEGMRKVIQRVTAVDIKEEVKKEKPPPPKKEIKLPPPPVVAPPPRMTFTPPPQQVTIVQAPPPPPIVLPPPPAAPPPPRFTPKSPAPKGNPASWATTQDYPGAALREGRQGVTSFRVSVGADGRVTNCEVTSSSGSPDLDQATCDKVSRRARFSPATDSDGSPTSGSYSNRIRWVIPKD